MSVEYIDAEVNPAEAQKYEIMAAADDRPRVRRPTQRATSIDEQAITNALKKLIEGKTKKVYFLQGHGERDPDDATTQRLSRPRRSALGR